MCKLLVGFGTSWVGNLHTMNIKGQFHQKNLGTGQTPPHPPLFDNARIEKALSQNILPLLTRLDLGPIRRNKQVIIRWWKPSLFRANNDRPVNQSNIAKVNLSSIFFAEYNNHVSLKIGRLRQTGFIMKDFRLLGLLISLRQLFKNPSQSIRQDIVGSCLPQNQNKQARIPQNGRLGHTFVYEAACIYSKSEIDLQWYRQQPEWRQSSSPICSSFLSPLM